MVELFAMHCELRIKMTESNSLSPSTEITRDMHSTHMIYRSNTNIDSNLFIRHRLKKNITNTSSSSSGSNVKVYISAHINRICNLN